MEEEDGLDWVLLRGRWECGTVLDSVDFGVAQFWLGRSPGIRSIQSMASIGLIGDATTSSKSSALRGAVRCLLWSVPIMKNPYATERSKASFHI